MKGLYIKLLILASIVLSGCNYDYVMPDLAVRFRFQVNLNYCYERVVSEEGYIPSKGPNGNRYTITFYNNLGEQIGYAFYGFDYYEKEKYFEAPLESAYFELKMKCYGKEWEYGSSLEICTIYIRQPLQEYQLWGVDNMPPHLFSYNLKDITEIEYAVGDFKSFYANGFSINELNLAVEKTGNVLSSYETFFFQVNEEGCIEELGKLNDEGNMYSLRNVSEVGILSNCFAETDSGEELICRIYSKRISTQWLEDNTSINNPYTFQVGNIQYEDENGSLGYPTFEKHTFYTSGIDPQYIKEIFNNLRYDLTSQSTYFYTYDDFGNIVTLDNFRIGEATTTTKEIGVYSICNGKPLLNLSISKVCIIYSKVISTEWLAQNTSANKLYEFEIEQIEYFIDHPDNSGNSGDNENPDNPNDNPDNRPNDPDIPSANFSFYIDGFNVVDKVDIVEKYGYELTSSDTYFYTKNKIGEIETLKKLQISGDQYQFSDVTEIGIYCDCFGKKLLGISISKICRIYSPLVSCDWLQKNTSSKSPYQFDIDKVEYFIDPAN